MKCTFRAAPEKHVTEDPGAKDRQADITGRGRQRPAGINVISLEENRWLAVAKVLSSFPRNELSEKI